MSGARPFFKRALTLAAVICMLVFASGSAHARKALHSDANQPIEIQSDRLEAYQEKRVVIFSGHAVATQGGRTIKADRLLIYYKSRSGSSERKDMTDIGTAGNIERMEARGHVTITEADRIVTGDHAVFYQDTRKIVMTGNAAMRDGKNTIQGGRIIVFLDEDRGVVESGETKRVTATIYPNENRQKGPK